MAGLPWGWTMPRWHVHESLHVDESSWMKAAGTPNRTYSGEFTISDVSTASEIKTVECFWKENLSPHVNLSGDFRTAHYIGQAGVDLHGGVMGTRSLVECGVGWYFEVTVVEITRGHPDGLALGVCNVPSWDVAAMPKTLDGLRDTVWFAGYDGKVWDGTTCTWFTTDWSSKQLHVGDVVGLLIDRSGTLWLFRNGDAVVMADIGVPTDKAIFPVVDLMGNTTGVSIQSGVPPSWIVRELQVGSSSHSRNSTGLGNFVGSMLAWGRSGAASLFTINEDVGPSRPEGWGPHLPKVGSRSGLRSKARPEKTPSKTGSAPSIERVVSSAPAEQGSVPARTSSPRPSEGSKDSKCSKAEKTRSQASEEGGWAAGFAAITGFISSLPEVGVRDIVGMPPLPSAAQIKADKLLAIQGALEKREGAHQVLQALIDALEARVDAGLLRSAVEYLSTMSVQAELDGMDLDAAVFMIDRVSRRAQRLRQMHTARPRKRDRRWATEASEVGKERSVDLPASTKEIAMDRWRQVGDSEIIEFLSDEMDNSVPQDWSQKLVDAYNILEEFVDTD